MRTIALLMTIMMGFGCKPKDGGGTSKSETVTNSSGETVRKMTLRLVDHTLGGMIFPDGVTVTAQGLDESETPVAFANGTTDAAVTYTRFTK